MIIFITRMLGLSLKVLLTIFLVYYGFLFFAHGGNPKFLAIDSCLDQGGAWDEIDNECRSEPYTETELLLVGSWLMPIPSMPNKKSGFILYLNGNAKSINMATLLYKHWKVEEKEPFPELIMQVESIGNGNTFIDEEIYEIRKLTETELHLRLKGAQRDLVDVYTKEERRT